jgi:hypothetical protein
MFAYWPKRNKAQHAGGKLDTRARKGKRSAGEVMGRVKKEKRKTWNQNPTRKVRAFGVIRTGNIRNTSEEWDFPAPDGPAVLEEIPGFLETPGVGKI